MIHFDRVPEPDGFDERARQRGNQWLASNPNARRPKDYWTPFRGYLAAGFRRLCGYCAMYIPEGGAEVDHYIDFKEDSSLAYEWTNYRYALPWMNKSKLNRKPDAPHVLDPFEVEDGWFEIILPSLQLVLTGKVPDHLRIRAEHTLRRLHLRDDERMIRDRKAWYDLYEEGLLDLEGLRIAAPLIAAAVEKREANTSGAQ